MDLLLILAILVVFEFAAARWGHDSRDEFAKSHR
jgi:hypothetical protein